MWERCGLYRPALGSATGPLGGRRGKTTNGLTRNFCDVKGGTTGHDLPDLDLAQCAKAAAARESPHQQGECPNAGAGAFVVQSDLPLVEPGTNAGSGRPRLARSAILMRLRTSCKSISAAIALFNPYSVGFERAKKAAFAALAACATMALINQRML